MYRSFNVRNFRGFSNLGLDGLKRINLLTGKNNVGKTALLEAIFLSLGPNNPLLSVTINNLRTGIEKLRLDAESIWGLLYRNGDFSNAIQLNWVRMTGEECSLSINLTETHKTSDLPLFAGLATTDVSRGRVDTKPNPSRLVLHYTGPEGHEVESLITVTNSGFEQKSGSLPKQPSGIFITSRNRDIRAEAERFSQVVEGRKQGVLLEALRIIEPRLKDLQLTFRGDTPMISGDIGAGPLLPLPLMGEGMGRLMEVLLSIADAKDGTVLVDEVENGFHYSILKDVWRVLIRAAEESNTQLFLTTHSYECLEAASSVLRELDFQDFCGYRLERVAEESRAVTMERDSFEAAIQFNMEIR